MADMKLSGTELNVAIAVAMGWRYVYGAWERQGSTTFQCLPHYSTDPECFCEVARRIDKLQLRVEYARQLWLQVHIVPLSVMCDYDIAALLFATLEQKCRAALATLPITTPLSHNYQYKINKFEAVQWGKPNSPATISHQGCAWIDIALERGYLRHYDDNTLKLTTARGESFVKPGDWFVAYTDNPCQIDVVSPERFAQVYELIS